MNADVHVTTELLWKSAAVLAVVDTLWIAVLARWISPVSFEKLGPWVMVSLVGFWAILWRVVLDVHWEPVYRYVFPLELRGVLPLLQSGLTGFIALLAWVSLKRWPLHPLIAFCVCGGLWGIASHVWAVYMGIVDRPPMLQGAAPTAAILFAAVEYAFYWAGCISLAALLRAGWGVAAGRPAAHGQES